jgi:hypothetical protein
MLWIFVKGAVSGCEDKGVTELVFGDTELKHGTSAAVSTSIVA